MRAVAQRSRVRAPLREIDGSNGWVTGEGMVTAAKVISWINIILSLLGLALFVVVLIAAAAAGSR